MNKDLLKISFLYLIRRKNNKWFRLILFVCSFLLTLILIISFNLSKLIDKCINNQIGFRTISVVNYNKTDRNQIMDELTGLDNVDDVFLSGRDEIYVTIDGTEKIVTLKRANIKTIPKVIYGRTINFENKNEIVCPINFYPSENEYDIKTINVDNDELINSKIQINYSNYDKKNLSNKNYIKTYEIVGLYQPSSTFDNLTTCYVNSNEVDEIANLFYGNDNQNDPNIMVFESFWLIVDSTSNIESVKNKIEDMGYSYNGINSSLDNNTIKIIKIIMVITLFIVINTIIVITFAYVKKRIIKSNDEISLKKYIGYKKNTIIKIYAFEMFLNNFLIYISSVLLSIIITIICIKTIPFLAYINMLIDNIEINIPVFIINFAIIVIIPIIMIWLIINKIYNKYC